MKLPKKNYSHFPRLLKTQQDREEFMTFLSFLQLGILPKGRGSLEDRDYRHHYCCLGIGCVTTIPEDSLAKSETGRLIGPLSSYQVNAPDWLKSLDDDVRQRLNLPDNVGLTNFNDGTSGYGELSHPEIADLLLELYGHELERPTNQI